MPAYFELSSIAASVGVIHGGEASIDFEQSGVPITVSLEIDSGVVRGMSILAGRNGLPEVVMRPETDEDRKGKARGMNVEVQLGDPVFDEVVYIDSDAPDQAIHDFLAPAAVRFVVRHLVASPAVVHLSDAGIRVDVRSTSYFAAESFKPLLEGILILARAPVPSFSGLETKERRGQPLLVLGFLAVPFAAGALLLTLHVFTPASANLPLLGAFAGAMASFALRPLFRRLTRGHSRSYSYYLTLAWLSLLELAMLGAAMSLGVNGGLDRSPRDKQVGRVVAAKQVVNDGDRETQARVRWADGHEDDHTFDDPSYRIRVGDAVTRVTRKGFFGVAWVEQDYTPHPDSKGEAF